MNTKNLPMKFLLFVVVPILLSLFVVGKKELKLGIDLRGGHSLVFEIRTNDRELADFEAQQKAIEEQMATATSEQKVDLEKKIAAVKDSITRMKNLRGNEKDLPNRIIAILKNRIDPHGLLSLEWRPMGQNRINVRMPAARKETQALKYEYLDDLTKLEASNVQPSSVRRVLATSGPARQDAITALAPAGSTQAKQLEELASLRDSMTDLQNKIAKMPYGDDRKKFEDDLDNLRVPYAQKLDALQKSNINVAQLQALLRLYVSQPERGALKKDDIQKRQEQYRKGIQDLVDKHPGREKAVQQVVSLYEKWSDTRQGLDDPSDLKRLIAKSGVLEFRIAPQKSREFDDQPYLKDLADNGPDAGRRLNKEYLWFPIHGERESFGGLVTSAWGGKEYVLLYNRAPHQMLRGSQDTWRLTSAYPTSDQFGRAAIGFEFDNRGAKLMGDLTTQDKDHPMAILLDDEVYSAPYIRATITDRGIIEGKFSADEVNELVRTLEAGSLPARLAVEDTPSGKIAKAVSETTFGPSLGAENLRLAVRAGLWGVIAVSAFMILYYRFAGIISVFAMVMNLLLTLGAMGILNAVMTLPGIAGIILGVGMAVDANVLIYERLREEQEKGQSVRMALKNAYEKAFSAIFDSNITTLLSCLILGWLGSEEIRGFAITLGLGVVFNLFTAVTVTRWIFQWMLEKRIVKHPLKLTKIIGVPNIDWMAKRYYFWGFSLATLVLGIVALVWQGKDILGIEFRSGTEAIVRVQDDAIFTDPGTGKPTLANDGVIAALVKSQAGKLGKGYEMLKENANAETLLDPNRFATFLKEHFGDDKRFPNVLTDKKVTLDQWKQAKLNPEAFTLLDKTGDGVLTADDLAQLPGKVFPSNAYTISTPETSVSKINDVARDAFGKEMITQSRLDYKPAPAGKIVKLGIAVDENGEAELKPAVIESSDREFKDDLSRHENGMAIVITNVQPPVTKADLEQRIRQARLQPDFENQLLNPTDVVDLDQTGGGLSTSFAILVNPAESLSRNQAAWDEFQASETKLIKTALMREEALETTNFDAAIASESKGRAIMAVVLGWVVMMLYLWLRFGTSRWGIAAILCIGHDLTIMVGMVALSDWLGRTAFGNALGIVPFKIDLTMVAALLTIIGYSVNDTIVVFDRIRENRGKLMTVTPTIINHSINQTLSRTILTPTTVIMTVLIMYIWGGTGIHAFNYAMMIGILFGTYSSIAVAAPILMGFKEAVVYHAATPTVPAAQ